MGDGWGCISLGKVFTISLGQTVGFLCFIFTSSLRAPFFVSCRYISHLSDFVAFFFSIFLRKDFMRRDLIQICLFFFLFDREIIIIERGRTFLFLSTKGI